MRHIRLLLLSILTWLLTGCTADPTTTPQGTPEDYPPKNPHAVPIEQALDDLQSLLATIDSPDQNATATRSGGVRRVKSVAAVSPGQLSATRSAATTDVEDLLYIVNFEDEAGYALLGADDRLEPVYAIVDEGSLTPEKMQYAATATEEQAEADGEFIYPLQVIARAVSNSIHIDSLNPKPTFPPSNGVWYIRKSAYTINEYLPPQIPVKLHQGYPCNAFSPIKNGTRCVAGCTAIAIAQVLIANYHQHGSVVGSIGGVFIDWPKISAAIANPTLLKEKPESEPISPEAMAVARLIREVGRQMNMDYGTTTSSGLRSRIQGVLEYVRYGGVHDWAYQFTKVRQMLLERKNTTIVCGSNTVGTKKNHSFNLDGWLDRSWTERMYYSGILKETKECSQRLIHCNFGWRGTCDGYYYYGAFDLRNGPVAVEEKENPTSTGEKYYDMSMIVTYTTYP